MALGRNPAGQFHSGDETRLPAGSFRIQFLPHFGLSHGNFDPHKWFPAPVCAEIALGVCWSEATLRAINCSLLSLG